MQKFWLSAFTLAILTACGGKNQTSGSNQASQTVVQTQANVNGSLIERINAHGVITVGTEGTYAPFSYHDETGKLTGYDVEVARAVADKLGVKIEFKETQWDGMMAGLKAGRFDLVANQVALTSPERQATFDKAGVYNWSGAAMLVREDESKIKSLDDIKGIKAAQTLSSNYGEMAVKAQAEIVPVDGMAQAITLVQQKRADLTINDSLSFFDYLKKNPNSGLKVVWESPDKVGSGLVLNKGNAEALAKINEATEAIKADGTLKRLGEQFFGKDVSEK